MPLSSDSPSRIPERIRDVRFEGHVRVDGLRDIDGHLTDRHDDGRTPLQFDRCDGLDTGGKAVRLYLHAGSARPRPARIDVH